MKPNFALGLTSDGITLWQRGRSGWLRVGAVDPASPEREAQLRDLSRIAHALAPEGVTTKLIIPDNEILFCDLEVSSRNRDDQAHEIRAQLAGRTPYPVEELDFDWTINGAQVHVAVVARETLVEAEDFAQSFGFNPVSASAAPTNGRFNREPFFGPTRIARSIIGDPDLIEREPEILREIGVVELPEPELVVQPDALPKSDAAPVTTAQVTAAPPDEAPAAREAAPGAKSKDASDKTVPASVTETTPDSKAADPLPKAKAKGKTGTPSPSKKFTDLLKSRGLPVPGEEERASAPPPAATPPATVAESSGPLTFSSRRTAPATRAPRATRMTPQATSTPEPQSDNGVMGSLKAGLAGSATLTSRSGAVARKLRDALGELKPKAVGQVQKATAALAGSRNGNASDGGPDKQSTPSAKTKPVPAEQAPPAVTPSTRKNPIETLRDRARAPDEQSEAERLTIFGARQQGEPTPSGFRRGMLVLSGVALLLGAVAIWVYFFTATQGPDVETAVPGEETGILAPDAVAPSESAALPESAPVLEDATPIDDIEAALGLEDAAQQPPLDMVEPEMLAQTEQIGGNAVPQTSPPADLSGGRVAALRSINLIAPQESVPLPTSPLAPAPFGSEPLPPTRAERAAAAAAAAAAEAVEPVTDDATATLLPAGEDALEIDVTQGRPPVAPPVRPEGIAPEPPAEPEPVVEAAPSVEATPAPEAEPATEATLPAAEPLDESQLEISVTEGRPAAVPPPRPEGISPEPEVPPAADTEPEVSPDSPDAAPGGTDIDPDQASLSTPPPGGVALTALRPAARPEAIVQAALVPDPPEIPGVADASSLAVAASLRPGARPSQFSAIVQRALRNAQTRSATPPASVQAAAPVQTAPVQTARAAVAAPVIPTSASVAREATERRAINLRQINLIGVMGTSNSRRALVRLSNGRVVTVRVGESLDGGRVTAIGEDELRYTRGNRNVVLRIAS